MNVLINSMIAIKFNRDHIRNLLVISNKGGALGISQQHNVVAFDDLHSEVLLLEGNTYSVRELIVFGEIQDVSGIYVNAGTVLGVEETDIQLNAKIVNSPLATYEHQTFWESLADRIEAQDQPIVIEDIEDLRFADVMELWLREKYSTSEFSEINVLGVDRASRAVLLETRHGYYEFNYTDDPINKSIDLVGLPVRVWSLNA